MQVKLLQNPNNENGFTIHFPYKAEDVETIKKCLGTRWDTKLKVWLTDGPEVLTDFQRFGIGIEWMNSDARKLATNFRQQLWDTIDCRTLVDSPDLFAYQQQGTDFLSVLPTAILADDRGTGKSKQALDAAAKVGAKKIMVFVTPKMVSYNWPDEVAKWQSGYTVGVVPDDKRERRAFWKNPPQIVIANYEKTRLEDWPFALNWDVVIGDELPRAAKNATTLIHKSLKRIIRRTSYFWVLTGSPMEKRLKELYNVMGLIRPAVLGNWMRFKSQHIETDWSGNITAVRNLGLLQERISPYILRRTKDEVLPWLPPKITENHFVKFTVKEQRFYQNLVRHFDPTKKANEQDDENSLTQLLRMRQFCCTPFTFDPFLGWGSKFETLKDIIDDWPDPVVVFCFFKPPLYLMQEWLKLPERALLTGDFQAKENIQRIKDFNAGKLGRIMLSSDAGNMGVNITTANLIIHYDQIFNHQLMFQREDRLHRIGQNSQVTVINLMCMDTVDYGTYVHNREEEKLFKDVIDGAEESIIRRLDAPRLRRLVRGKL